MMATGPLLLEVDVEVAELLEEQVPPPMWPMPRRLVPSPTEAATTIWGLFLHNGRGEDLQNMAQEFGTGI